MSGMLGPLGDMAAGVVSSTIGPLFTRLIDLIPDPAEKARQAALIQEKLMDADAQMIAAQNAINLAEANNQRTFVSGWRPFIGWCCGAEVAIRVVMHLANYMAAFVGYHPIMPTIDNGELMALLVPMLGLGAMKSAERLGGVSNEGQKPTQIVAIRPSRAVMNLPS